MQSWAELVDAVRGGSQFEDARAALLAEARRLAALPIVRRVYRLEDVGKHRTWLDGRTRNLGPETAEVFALAMSDAAACGALATELPLLAAACRLTGESVFRDRVLSQLREMATWSPLQRPGWTCFAPGRRLPPDGRDGNWLATGTGIRAICDALELMPEGSVGPDLRASLEQLLTREIDSIVDDWRTQRSWFIRANNPITNQWMLPTEGLVRACLALGKEKHREAYELGVRNTLRALDAHGKRGEFEEGIGYAAFTVTSMLHTAHAMAVAGDRRAMDHPFLRNFPTWMVHHIQPGQMLINCFDAGSARAVGRLRTLLCLLAVCTGSEVARWALEHQVGGSSDDLAGLLYRALPRAGAGRPPPLYAAYERATRVNWRDTWKDDGTGVWVRGGHALDQHDHYDRGHVNFIFRGRPILIEAGTPSYDNELIRSHYQSPVGHNVLQVDSSPAVKGVAPIDVHRLDDTGGDVTVDVTKCYPGLGRWVRRVRWDSQRLNVADEVVLAEGKRDTLTFRWHLGTEKEVAIAGGGGAFTITWPDATMTLDGSAGLVVSQERLPDNTLLPESSSRASGEHTHICIVVRSAEPVSELRLTTSVVGRAAASRNACDWPTPRHDTRLTARQPCAGAMREPPAVINRTAIATSTAPLRVFASRPLGSADRALALVDGALECYDLSGRLLWQSHPPGINFEAISATEDLDGNGRVEIALMAGRPTSPLSAAILLDADSGQVVWRYDVEPMSYQWYLHIGEYLPQAVGKQLIVLMHGYPPDRLNGYMAMFEFPAPGKPPAQRWRYDFHQYTCYPSLLQSDVDGDGVKELCVETHSRMWVLDALTGEVKQFVQWDVSPANVRSYGLVQFVDLNGDGAEDFLCIANFAQHHEVLLNEKGKLRLAWAHGWENSVTTSKIATTWPEPPVADVDGDGRLEVIVSMFNSERDARWLIRIYDALTGKMKVRVPGCIARRASDVDGDGRSEILVDISGDPTQTKVAGAALLRVVNGRARYVWREHGARVAVDRPRPRRDAGGQHAGTDLVVARGDGTYALAARAGKVELKPYTPPPPAPRPDVSKVKAAGGAMVPPPLVKDLDGDGTAEVIHTWQGKVTVYRWDRGGGLRPMRQLASSGDPVLADLDADGKTEMVIGEAAAARAPVVRAVRADGSLMWESRLPKTDRRALPHGGRAVYLQAGRFTGKATPDVYALFGTPVVRSVVLDGRTGKVVWEKGELPDIERYHGPTVNMASVYDVNGDGADDLVFTNPDYYCVASGRTGELLIGPLIPQKIFNQPSQGLYTLPAILEQQGGPLVVLCAGHYFLGCMSLRAEPLWYSLPEVGLARSGAEGFLRLAEGRWLIGFGRQNGAFACLDAATGSVRWELPIAASGGDVVACDVNGDGCEEFVFGDSHGFLWAVGDNGDKPAVAWKVNLGRSVGSPVIADLDGEGLAEIVVPTGDGSLCVLGAQRPARREQRPSASRQ